MRILKIKCKKLYIHDFQFEEVVNIHPGGVVLELKQKRIKGLGSESLKNYQNAE